MQWRKALETWIALFTSGASLLSDVFTIFASGIAIYLFVFKRKAISSVFSLLLNYSYQLSLSEMKEKLERLNDCNAKNPEHLDTIMNILHELLGQVRGNDKLKLIMADQVRSIEVVVTNDSKGKRITEPQKRALISEIREKVRHLNVQNIDDLVGGAL
ncbi:hypothetical protein [Pseudomonas nunensis]|uniref:hypothetical protein n=1 Tax=Pseudomonas nunensis TaxID=2961896 RepID=UPI0006B4388D|nr:hypothetical protein [Pseudomonas nunensis]KOY02216.1 hypothetical protein AM274_13680 [Pseudomonas nunensis]